MEYYGIKNTYTLGSEITSGGEGTVYNIDRYSGYVAKIYLPESITKELEKKLSYMAKHRPKDKEILKQIAWPIDILRDKKGSFVGFIMPRMNTDKTLIPIYKYPPKGNITLEQKVILAYNISLVISEVHKTGYVFGDFNPKNIGVNLQTGHVAFYDTDSYHVNTGSEIYPCVVAFDGYVAPELIKKVKQYGDYASTPYPTFTKETDNFALSIHIFKLLMNGFSPYDGIKENASTSQASPGVGNKPIEKDMYCFKQGNKPRNGAIPHLDELSPKIQKLFTRTFIDGVNDPSKRATPEEWKDALMEYKNSLVQCQNNPAHFYFKGNKACPYCAADKRYIDAQNAVMNGSQGGIGGGQISFSTPISIPTSPTQFTPTSLNTQTTYSSYTSAYSSHTVVSWPKRIVKWVCMLAAITCFITGFGAFRKTDTEKDMEKKTTNTQRSTNQSTATSSSTDNVETTVSTVNDTDIAKIQDISDETYNKLNEIAIENIYYGLDNLAEYSSVYYILKSATENNPNVKTISDMKRNAINRNECNLQSMSLFIPKNKKYGVHAMIKLNYMLNIDIDYGNNYDDELNNFSGNIYFSYIWEIDNHNKEYPIMDFLNFKVDYNSASTDYDSWYRNNIVNYNDEYVIDEYFIE